MVYIMQPNGDFGWYCSYKCAESEMASEMFLHGEKGVPEILKNDDEIRIFLLHQKDLEWTWDKNSIEHFIEWLHMPNIKVPQIPGLAKMYTEHRHDDDNVQNDESGCATAGGRKGGD